MNFLGCDDKVQLEQSEVVTKKPVDVQTQEAPPQNNPCPRCSQLMEVIEMKGFINKGKSFQSCSGCGFKTEPK